MRWLAILHTRLRHVGEGDARDAYKLIAFALCRPVFQAHNLLFKIAYASGQRRLRLLCCKQRRLGIKNEALEVDLDFIDRRLRGGSIKP